MPTVPGVLLLSGYGGQGGLPALMPIPPLGNQLRYLNERDLFRFVPQAADGTQLATYRPWYDGTSGPQHQVDEGASTTTVIKVTPNPGWTVNQWALRPVTLTSITAAFLGQAVQVPYGVVSNTADTVTINGTHNFHGLTDWQLRIGQGRFTQYHACPGFVGPLGGGGSAWQTGGAGIGPDVRIVPELDRRVFPSSPHFYFAKFCSPGSLATAWVSGGAARAAFLTELALMNAAAALEGNTIQWVAAGIDFADNDLRELAANNTLVGTHVGLYQTNMGDFINFLRGSGALNNSGCKILLTNHHPDIWGVGAPLAAAALRNANFALAASMSNVALLEMGDATFAPLAGAQEVANYNAERQHYSFPSILKYGDKFVTLTQRMLTAAPAAVASTGFPLYLLLGDSIMVGQIPALWMANTASEKLIGPGPGTVKPDGQYIFNKIANQFEAYNPNTNSNTAGTVTGLAGPESAFIDALSVQHPNGFGVIKIASNGATLVKPVTYIPNTAGGRWAKTAGELYPEMLSLVAAAKEHINDVLGLQADFRGIHISLGHNDAPTAPDGIAYAAALPAFVTNLRQDLTTRTSGAAFPICFRLPQAGVGGTDPSAIATVRNALELLAKTDGKVRVINCDDLERDRTDDLHENPQSAVTHGYRAAAALVGASI